MNGELDTDNYLRQLASAGFHECDLASVKNFNGEIYHFRRNSTMPLDHPCEITRENGSKHDTKQTILSGPSASENSSNFIAGFSIRMGVDSKP